MSHPVPKDLKGEERILSIPYMDLYLNKTGLIYNGGVTILAGLIGKITGSAIVLISLLIILNILVYPLAQSSIKKNEFDGGGVRRDKFYIRKFTYRKRKNIYLRRENKVKYNK